MKQQIINQLKEMIIKAQAVKTHRNYWEGYETALSDVINILEKCKK